MCKMSMDEQYAEISEALHLLKKARTTLLKLAPYGWEFDASLANVENAITMLSRKEESSSLCGVQG